MIFIITGTQVYPFDRVLRAVDELIERGMITEEVFAQTGSSAYEPRHYACERFLDADVFRGWVNRADIVLTHGGTGAIVGALKAGKRVVAVARQASFGEHCDDHQLQIVRHFESTGFILVARDMARLDETLQHAREFEPKAFQSNTQGIIRIIDDFIQTREKARRGAGKG